jgi:hypothetical protein
MTYSLTGLTVSSTYPRIVQVINSNEFYDGLGNPLNIGAGTQGPTGPQGVTGPSGGPPGSQGPTGPSGIDGLAGPQGATGPLGGVRNDFFSASNVTITHNLGYYPVVQVIDINGEVIMPITISHSTTNSYFVNFGSTVSGYVITSAGAKGDNGSQGPTGPANGPQGFQGTTGPAGVSGFTGPQGITGPSGPQGIQGPTGSNLPFYYTASAPSASSLTAGSRWFNSDTGVEYVYIDDGDSLQWVQPTSTIAGSLNYYTMGVTASTYSITLYSQYGPEYFGVSSSTISYVYLPTNVVVGKVITIKDESGQASLYPIYIIPSSGETIDNSTQSQVGIDYGSLTLLRRSNNWWVI